SACPRDCSRDRLGEHLSRAQLHGSVRRREGLWLGPGERSGDDQGLHAAEDRLVEQLFGAAAESLCHVAYLIAGSFTRRMCVEEQSISKMVLDAVKSGSSK